MLRNMLRFVLGGFPSRKFFLTAFFFLLVSRAVPVYALVFIEKPPITLSWTSSPESDIKGYQIHRSTSYGGPYAKVNYGVVTGTSWQDWNVTAGSTYYYRLGAVDVYGNVSPLSSPSEAAVVTEGDFDADGFSDSFEDAVGSDPLDSASQPTADVLILSPDQALLPIGGDENFSVLGLFESTSGQTLEYDMTCIVDYHSSPSGIVTTAACGNAVGQAEGIANVWAWQVINGQTVAASNQVATAVDGSPPHVNPFETQPYDGQGMNEDKNGNGILDAGEDLDGDHVLDRDTGSTPRVPTDTGIVIRVEDDPLGANVGIDPQSIQLKINNATAPVRIRPVHPDDFHEVDVSWVNPSQFTYDEVVIIELSASDAAGNDMYFREAFQVESLAQHQWALAHRPVQTTRFLQSGVCEVAVTPLPDDINDESLQGAKILFNCDEPVPPRFGPVGELPPVDIAAPAGTPVALEPIAEFESPVTVVVPLPDAVLTDLDADGTPDTGLDQYLLYLYNGDPSVQWRALGETSGWMVEGSRSDKYQTTPPAIQLQVDRSAGIQAGLDAVAFPPRPDIRVNGIKEALTVSPDTTVSVTLSLASGTQKGQLADWWVIADTPNGRYYYREDTGTWETRRHTSARVPLTDVSFEEIFHGLAPFGAGDYSICFGVDANADGRIDLDWQDTVVVHVQN